MDKRVIESQVKYQLDAGTSQKINSPKFLFAAHQTDARSAAPDKLYNTAVFDILHVRKYFAEVDGNRCPGESFNVD